MLSKIDKFLDRITMYRLVLCFLIALLGLALILSSLRILSFTPLALLFSALVLILTSWIVNEVTARILKIPTNFESTFITGFILALIVSPPRDGAYLDTLLPLVLIAGAATLSKYILRINKRHIFNPAAFGALFIFFVLGWGTSWWVGSIYFVIPVLIGGGLILRKLKQFDVVLSFLTTFILGTIFIVQEGSEIISSLTVAFTASYLWFFATVMLTEPLTMPAGKRNRIWYGGLVGILFIPQLSIGSFVLGPEMALLIGNIFSYFLSPQKRYVLSLKEKIKREEGIYDFVFKSNKKIDHKPGQYLEWTLGGFRPDNRGNRRYFTIASSPTEEDVLMGARFYPEPSSFKQHLAKLTAGESIVGGKLSGDFVMPDDKTKKLAFVAGGIGITPFRSMTKYLIDTNQSRDIVLLYSNNLEKEIAYKDIFQEAESKFGLKTLFTLTNESFISPDWMGLRGFVSKEMIQKYIPDFSERVFYISGSHNMVTAFQKLLNELGVPDKNIKTDFFPGLV